ncbi:MAG TPA: permease prefix domain 1-containing protein [Candidatus Limnocylindrales bacterium]
MILGAGALLLAAVLAIVILLPVGAIKLVRRSERRLNWQPNDDGRPDSEASPTQPHEVSAYLDRLTSTLSLPAADAAEVRAELADHIADSIESLEAEGLDREKAIRESLARLGSPTELGDQIRAAHQSTRRLLAGAGGGIFAAGGGFVIGYFTGFAIAIGVFLLGAACVGLLSLAGVRLFILEENQNSLINSLLIPTAFIFAAAYATRYAVRVCAGLSRRAPRSVAVFWASTSAIVFGIWAIFGLSGPMSWPAVVAYLCVPIVAFTAAFFRIERPLLHVSRNAVLAGIGGFLIVILGAGLLFAATGSAESGNTTLTTIAIAHTQGPTRGSLPPDAPAEWVPQGSIMGGGVRMADTGGDLYSAITDQQAPVSMATALTNWHDLRFEAWHWIVSSGPNDAFGADTRYSSPAVTLPAEVHPTWIQAIFHLDHLRDQGPWEVILTGIGPDGQRYEIADCGGGMNTQFHGSVWDWITAPL